MADARFQLVGVVSPKSPQASREGVALIAIDGQAPKAYRVGAKIEGETVLQSVSARGASLGLRGGETRVALDIAPLAPAATGTLPGLEGNQAAAAPPPPLPNNRGPLPPGAISSSQLLQKRMQDAQRAAPQRGRRPGPAVADQELPAGVMPQQGPLTR